MEVLSGEHLEVLRELCRLLPLGDVNWALTGSAGHRLQGVDVAVHDIDVQADEAGARAAAAFLGGYTVRPLAARESPFMWSLFGVFEVSGITVEVMGGVRKRQHTEESWGPATDPAEHRCMVSYHGLVIPVMSLAYEAVAYERIGRPGRARLLRQVMSASGEM